MFEINSRMVIQPSTEKMFKIKKNNPDSEPTMYCF